MITRIEISGFKSFWDFSLDFAPFTVVAGANASGKSNLFDAMRLLSNLATTDLRTAFTQKMGRGEMHELFSCYADGRSATRMTFAVEMLVPRTVSDAWGQKDELKTPRMRYELEIERYTDNHGIEQLKVVYEKLERIASTNDKWVKQYMKNQKAIWSAQRSGGGGGKPYISTQEDRGVTTINMRKDMHGGGRDRVADTVSQTVLSSVTSNDFPHVFAAKQELMGWHYMQLNPEVLREPAKIDLGVDSPLGYDGTGLAAVMYRMKMEDPHLITLVSRTVTRFLKEYKQVDVVRDDEHRLFVIKLINQKNVAFTSRVLSEGTLRLITLAVMMHDPKHQGLLCFEEPENGIHPARIGQMMDLLSQLAYTPDYPEELRQVVVNTHSPKVMRLVYNQTDKASLTSLVYSRIVTHFEGGEYGRTSMNVTHMVPVSKSRQMVLTDISDKEREFCITEVESLLNTGEEVL